MARDRPIDVWCDLVCGSDLNAHHKVVGWALSLHMDNTTLAAWPSLDKLAEESGVARSTVQLALKALEQDGFVAIIRGGKHRGPNGTWRQDGNQYRGLIPPGTDNRYRQPGTDNRVPTTAYRGFGK